MIETVGFSTPFTAKTILRVREQEYPIALAYADIPSLEDGMIDSLAGRWLHPVERATLTSFSTRRRRVDYVAGRLLSKVALTLLLPGVEPCSILVETGVFGDPVIVNHGSVRVSIAHTDGYACAVAFPATVRLGIDVERMRASALPALRAALGEELSSRTEIQRAVGEETLAFALWTQRESLGKAVGIGLTASTEVYRAENLEWRAPVLTADFAALSQFACQTVRKNRLIISLTYPRLGSLDIPLNLLGSEASKNPGTASC